MRLADVDVIIKDLTAMKRVYDAIELDGMIKALKEAPTVEAEPVKHGKWIEKYCSWYCSECGKSGYKGYIPAKPSDFCPNCGARMDGE